MIGKASPFPPDMAQEPSDPIESVPSNQRFHAPRAAPGDFIRAPGADIPCAHCGLNVLQNSLRDAEGAVFCCEGCRQIHAVLAGPEFGTYRELLSLSGKQAPRANLGTDYHNLLASLDEPGALISLGRWEGTRHSLTLECTEITCAGCAWLLENLLRETSGVRGFEVDFVHGEMFLDYDVAEASLRGILERLARFGYRLKPRSESAPGRPAPDYSLLYRIAVAGFCFVNAMAFSIGIYMDAFRGMPKVWMDSFSLLGFALSIPAVAYCAFPFYSGAWRALRGRRFNVDVTVTIGILLSFALSGASALRAGGSNFSDSLTGLIFFLLVGRWAVRRFEAGLALKGRWFEALRPGLVRVRRGTELVSVDARDIAAGDVLEVPAGAFVPVDGSLEAEDAWMDTSLLTGESRPTRVARGEALFAGYQNLRGRAWMQASGQTGGSRIARLGTELQALARGRQPMADGTGRVAKWFTLAVAAFGCLAFALHVRDGFIHALAVSASVFIVSCSCALALAAPISRGLGLKRARAMGFHFRAQTTLEALREVRCVLFDKTGTLTFTHRSVDSLQWTKAWAENSYAQAEALGRVKALAQHSLHPVSLSLCRALDGEPDIAAPFTSILEIAHFGLVGKTAPEDRALSGLDAYGEIIPPDFTGEVCICRFGAWHSDPEAFGKIGYPVPESPREEESDQPAADTALFIDGRLAALVRFTEEIKPEVRNLMAWLRGRGIATVLLSGDNAAKVEGFASAGGIENVHASLSPEAKRNWASHYRGRFGRCLAVGDGFNDSLLFGASDLAMAIGGGAVDLSAGTDILSTAETPARLASLFTLAGSVSRSIRLCFWTSGAYNAFALALALRGWVTPLTAAILMPVSGLSLCLVAYLTIPRNSNIP